MKEKISKVEWASRGLSEGREGLIEDAKRGGYDPRRFSYTLLFHSGWRKSVARIVFFSLVAFAFSPTGIFIDIKEKRFKNAFFKFIFFFIFSIPLFLFAFLILFFLTLMIFVPLVTFGLRITHLS